LETALRLLPKDTSEYLVAHILYQRAFSNRLFCFGKFESNPINQKTQQSHCLECLGKVVFLRLRLKEAT